MTLNAIIALGGNLPYGKSSPENNIKRALNQCPDYDIHLKRVSSIWRTPCFPVGAGPDFANAVAEVSFADNPEKLLEACHAIETNFGRTRDARWSARTLDIDLICIGDMILPDRQTVSDWINKPNELAEQAAPEQLLLPHPRIQDRGFVLVPMAELCPDWRHPILRRTVLEMKNALPIEEIRAIQAISGPSATN